MCGYYSPPNDTRAKYTEQSVSPVNRHSRCALPQAASGTGMNGRGVMSAAPTAAAVWDERTCEVAGGAAKMLVQFSELVFLLHWSAKGPARAASFTNKLCLFQRPARP